MADSSTFASFSDLMLVCVFFSPSLSQEDEVGLYVGLASCLSEMCDTEIERITRVTEVEKRKTKKAFPTTQTLAFKPVLLRLGGQQRPLSVTCGTAPRQCAVAALLANYLC